MVLGCTCPYPPCSCVFTKRSYADKPKLAMIILDLRWVIVFVYRAVISCVENRMFCQEHCHHDNCIVLSPVPFRSGLLGGSTRSLQHTRCHHMIQHVNSMCWFRHKTYHYRTLRQDRLQVLSLGFMCVLTSGASGEMAKSTHGGQGNLSIHLFVMYTASTAQSSVLQISLLVEIQIETCCHEHTGGIVACKTLYSLYRQH